MRRKLAAVLPVLFLVMMGARIWLARAQEQERERTMRSLVQHTADFDRMHLAERQIALNDKMAAERQADLARLEAMGRAIEVPKPLDLTQRPPTAPSAEPEKPKWDWSTTPHSLWVSYADLSKSAAAQARSDELVDKAARKALVARLTGIHDRLKAALAGGERFSDAAVVRAELAEAEAALASLDGALEPTSVHGRMTRENLGDFLEMLRAVPTP